MPGNAEKSVDELVQEVRSRAYEKIKALHGTMRMLRVNRRVPVDDIYIDLNVLEQVSCDRTFSDWRREFQPDLRSFDRLGVGGVLEEGLPALDMVQKHPKLMVFGKPGSGKTTFLKSLALQCIELEGHLQWEQQDYVPIFITLQKFAKDARKRLKFSLFDYIYHQEFCSWGEKNQQVVEAILEQGKALVLLDGLDEVQGQEYKPVIEEVESFCEYFHSNRFLITCRTQNQRYKFEGFTDVEVADFKPEQINRFIKRWFAVVADNAESEKLALELTGQLQQPQNKQIAELAVTPVLLNLICFVFRGEKGNLPKNRADLYKKGLRDLLEGLDESKGVQREPIYEKLTPEAKEDLLAYLAVTLFEANDYFPQQETLENLIIEHFQISRSKAIKVLKSIEEQSGLIVERSEGFWSFSHLTFQEYFTAKWFCDRADWQGLTSHITEKYWREVFLLVVGILPSTEFLLRLLKQRVDALIAADEKLQQFLTWVSQKSQPFQGYYKLAAVRALYFLFFQLETTFDTATMPVIELTLSHTLDPRIEFTPKAYVNTESNGSSTDTVTAKVSVEFSYNLYSNLAVDLCLSLALAYALVLTFDLKFAHSVPDITGLITFKFDINVELKQSLQQLQKQLPNRQEKRFREWWKAKGQAWAKQLRSVMIKHCYIGRDWRLSNEQKKFLQWYYDANETLVYCLNSGCMVSDEVRKEIEETLLLPVDDIKKRQQRMQVADIADE